MDFDYTSKVQALREKLLAFFDEHIYPNERAFSEEIAANRAAGNAWVDGAHGKSQGQSARGRTVESVPACIGPGPRV